MSGAVPRPEAAQPTPSDAAGAAGDRAAVNAVWAAVLVDALVAGGVRHVCVAPGSRSTPLAWAVAERAAARSGDGGSGDPGAADAGTGTQGAPTLTCSVHLDERGAGFFAVGYASATGRAAAVVCTSGTAAANLLPAVVEAHHSRLPLVVVTADRPPDLRDRGAWQAIDQVKLYGGYTRWYHELGEAAADCAALRYAAAVGARAAAAARSAPCGPVHLNVPLREPLGPAAAPPAIATPAPPRFASADLRPGPAAVAELAARIAAEPRGLVVAGRPALNAAARAAVARLAAAAGYPVLAEPLSGLRFGVDAGADPVIHPAADTDAAVGAARRPVWVTGYDALLRPDSGLAVPPPRLVLRIGGSLTWKHVSDYLGRADAAWQVAIDPERSWDDPTGRVGLRIEAPVAATLDAVADALPARGDGVDDAGAGWRAGWRAASEAVAGVRASFVAATDGEAARSTAWLHAALVELLPEGALLAVANSMAVRDLDTFGAPGAKALHVVGNRGAAGIDGTLSSALGAAFGSGRPAALLTGDLAFLHDAGGFGPVADLVARYGAAALDLFVVIVDDGGGGIFEHLPVAAADRRRFETFFATPQAADLAALCRAWGVPCRAAPDPAALAAAAAVPAPIRAAVVPIDRAANTAAHRAYWRAAAAAAAAATAGWAW